MNKQKKGWRTRRHKCHLRHLVSASKFATVMFLIIFGGCVTIKFNQALKDDLKPNTALASSTEEIIKEEIKVATTTKKEYKAKYAYMNGSWGEKQLAVRIKTEKEIRRIADEESFQYTDYLVKLADCEGMLGLTLKNDKGNYPKGSVDEGYFQWNSYWQKEINERCAYNLECETKEAIKKINNGGQGIWICDKYVRGVDNFR